MFGQFSFNKMDFVLQSTFKLITRHFVGPGGAFSPMCVCVCLRVQMILFQLNEL